MHFLNNFFSKIYLLTIPRNAERCKSVSEELKNQGIEFEIIYGIDGHDLTSNKISQVYSRKKEADFREKYASPKRLKINEIACSLSHCKLYKLILENNYDTCLILEDDVKILPSDHKELLYALEELPEKWDLLYLGHENNIDYMSLYDKTKANLLFPLFNFLIKKEYNSEYFRNMFKQYYSQHLELPGAQSCTFSYVVTRSGAEKLLNAQTPVFLEADTLIKHLITQGKIEAFSLKRHIFTQNKKLGSSINL